MPALSDISVDAPSPGRDDTLVLALRAVLVWHGADIAYDDLAGRTGCAAMFTFNAGELCPNCWDAYARDAFVVAAAGELGLSLRDLHPPDAVPLPAAPPEFELHFRDSYVPLIEASLANGQPVLAWAGWPPPDELSWGVVTALDDRRRCRGRVPGRADAVALERAAWQCYVVQSFRLDDSSPSVSLQAAIRARFVAAWQDRLPGESGVSSGPAALRQWRERLATEPRCPLHGGTACLDSLSRRFVARCPSAAEALRDAGLHAAARALASVRPDAELLATLDELLRPLRG